MTHAYVLRLTFLDPKFGMQGQICHGSYSWFMGAQCVGAWYAFGSMLTQTVAVSAAQNRTRLGCGGLELDSYGGANGRRYFPADRLQVEVLVHVTMHIYRIKRTTARV